MPDAVETFDAADGLLAIGRGRSMRDFLFAIIPHKSWVNLQLADGVGPAQRGRPDRGHRQADPPRQGPSVEDAGAPWLRAAIEASSHDEQRAAAPETQGVTVDAACHGRPWPEIEGMDGASFACAW